MNHSSSSRPNSRRVNAGVSPLAVGLAAMRRCDPRRGDRITGVSMRTTEEAVRWGNHS